MWVDDTGELRQHSMRSLAKAMTDAGCPTNQSTVSRWCNGRSRNPSGRALMALSDVFGVMPMVWFREDPFRWELDRLKRLRRALERVP